MLANAPSNVRAAWVLGQVLLAQGRSAEAVAPLQATAQISRDPAVEMLLARALANLGCTSEALALLRQATARRPGFEMAFLELGDQLGKAGRFDEAQAAVEAGLACFPRSAALRMSLGYSRQHRNDRSGARALFAQILAEAPRRHDAKLALANLMVLDGDYTQAASLFRLALDQRPDDPMTRIALGKCLLELGARTEGEAALRAAVRDEPRTAGLAITALASASTGRLFLRPSAAANFL